MTELEKKADKYAYEVYSTRPLGDDPTDDEIKEAYIQGYKDAMAWHYPSKGEYPKIGEKVFCKDYIGEYNVAEYQGNSVDGEPPWLFNDKIDDYVLAWQYIIPPKEEA